MEPERPAPAVKVPPMPYDEAERRALELLTRIGNVASLRALDLLEHGASDIQPPHEMLARELMLAYGEGVVAALAWSQTLFKETDADVVAE